MDRDTILHMNATLYSIKLIERLREKGVFGDELHKFVLSLVLNVFSSAPNPKKYLLEFQEIIARENFADYDETLEKIIELRENMNDEYYG